MGAIRFKSLLDTQSTPQLVFGFNFLTTFSNITMYVKIVGKIPDQHGYSPIQETTFSNITMYVKIVGKIPDQHGYSPIQGTWSKKGGELLDKYVPYFQQESGPCHLDWRITIHSNVDLVFFQQC